MDSLVDQVSPAASLVQQQPAAQLFAAVTSGVRVFTPYGIVDNGNGTYSITSAPGDLQFYRMVSGAYRPVLIRPSAGGYHDANGNFVGVDPLATPRVVPVLLGNGIIKLVELI